MSNHIEVRMSLTEEQAEKFKAYRDRRRIERGGRILQVQSALAELVEAALAGEPVPDEIGYAELPGEVADLKRRVTALERRPAGGPVE